MSRPFNTNYEPLEYEEMQRREFEEEQRVIERERFDEPSQGEVEKVLERRKKRRMEGDEAT
jgi:hypothetical protein